MRIDRHDERMEQDLLPLTREAIREFKALYKQKQGDTLSDDDAAAMAARVLRVFAVIYRVPLETPKN